MKLLHEQSSQCLCSELDLFSSMNLSGSGEDYIDLNNTLLEVKTCIKTTNDSPVDAAVAVAPINNTLHSLFSQIDVYLNDVNVASATTTYPYRANIETHLNYGTDAKKNKASSSNVLYR